MNLRTLRRLAVATAGLALAAGTAVAVAPAATAAPLGKPDAIGDLTGDGIGDRFWFAAAPGQPNACGYTLQAGLGGGRFATPVSGRLPVRDTVPAGERTVCPGLAVVVKGPTPAQNQLATSFNSLFGPYSGPSGQTFAGFGTGTVRFTGGFQAQGQGDQLLSPADFDGDGYYDLYEPTGQFSPQITVGRNGNWHLLYSPQGANDADLQFLDLNLAGGTDILAVESLGAGHVTGVAVVDGRTGARQTLGGTNPDTDGTAYTLSAIDIDHNRYPDLLLVGRQPQDDGSVTTTTQQFLNQSQGARWYFKPLAPTTA